MLKNYCRIAWRHLRKSKLYSSINIAGLSIGMAVTLLIGLWVWDEISFNYYYVNHRTLGLMYSSQTWNGKISTDNEVDIPLADVLRSQYAGDFKQVALVSGTEPGHLLIAGEKNIAVTSIYMQPQLPEMLTLHMVSGSKDGLKDPSSGLIAESVAKTLFGTTDVIGKSIRLDSIRQVRISGVYEDIPRSALFRQAKVILPWDTYEDTHQWVKNAAGRWGYHFGRIIVQLNEGASFAQVSAKLKNLTRKYEPETKEEIFIHPMDKVHLYTAFKDGKIAGGPIRFVWLFGIIGVFVLLLACINFMNLSTARSEQRAKEVGIRKTVGSLRSHLVGQFLCESIMLALAACILAIFIVYVSLPSFNRLLANKELMLPWDNAFFWLITLGFTLFTGVIAGSYPAFYLSGFSPLKVLKGTFKAGTKASIPRKALVTIQFTVSIVLIIGTVVVYRQIQFAKDRPVGYTREGLITLNAAYAPDLIRHIDAVKEEALQTGVLEDLTTSNQPLTESWIMEHGFSWEGKDPTADHMFAITGVNPSFGPTIKWKIKEGKDFYPDWRADTGRVIANQAAIDLMGLKDPVGKILTVHNTHSTIIAVVDNILTNSPFDPPIPTFYWVWGGNYIHMRLKPGTTMHTALDKLTPLFKRYESEHPLDFTFVDDDYDQKFIAEQRIGRLAAFFTTFAIFISCLGLFGLASFVAEQRTKEIGIRKVLGASVFSIWSLLSKEFLTLVMISLLISIPIAWVYMDRWLHGYEYHASVSWWIFAAAGIAVLIVTLLTVSVQSVRAALMNPARSLKTE